MARLESLYRRDTLEASKQEDSKLSEDRVCEVAQIMCMHRQTDGALLHALRAAKVLALALVTGNPAPTRLPCWLLGLVLGTWLGGSR